MMTLQDLLEKAEIVLSTPDPVSDYRVGLLHSALVAEGIIPTSRASQHGSAHMKFSAAMMLAVDAETFDMASMRSTTLLAVLGSAGMPAMLDKMVKAGLLTSEMSDYKALGIIHVTDKLKELCPKISLETLLENE